MQVYRLRNFCSTCYLLPLPIIFPMLTLDRFYCQHFLVLIHLFACFFSSVPYPPKNKKKINCSLLSLLLHEPSVRREWSCFLLRDGSHGSLWKLTILDTCVSCTCWLKNSCWSWVTVQKIWLTSSTVLRKYCHLSVVYWRNFQSCLVLCKWPNTVHGSWKLSSMDCLLLCWLCSLLFTCYHGDVLLLSTCFVCSSC